MSYDPNQAPQPQWDPQQGRWVLPEQGAPHVGGAQGYGDQHGYGQPPQGPYGPWDGRYSQQAQGGAGGPQYPGQPRYVPQPSPQPQRRKWPWIVGAVVLLFIVIANGGRSGTTSPTGRTTGAPGASGYSTSTSAPTTIAAPTIPLRTYSGTGDDVVRLDKPSGIAVVSFSCPACTSNTSSPPTARTPPWSTS